MVFLSINPFMCLFTVASDLPIFSAISDTVIYGVSFKASIICLSTAFILAFILPFILSFILSLFLSSVHDSFYETEDTSWLISLICYFYVANKFFSNPYHECMLYNDTSGAIVK